MIRKMAEARDEALWEAPLHLYQMPTLAAGVEFPHEDGRPRPEIWCKSCLSEVLLR